MPGDARRHHGCTHRRGSGRTQRVNVRNDFSGNITMRFIASLSLLALLAFTAPLPAQPPAQKWVVSWIGSVHGPYPSGNPSAQPDMKLAFPSAEAGARDQSFR